VARAAVVRAAQRRGLVVQGNHEALHDDLYRLAATWGERLRAMAPGVMVLGGEPTVILPENPGRGGRNQALALALAREIAGDPGLTVIVGGTDGSDGPTDAAGGIVDGMTWGVGAATALAAADSGRYLDAQGALLVTGPTGTNVMDLVVALRA
jgi:hydroxypyruvate reductase